MLQKIDVNSFEIAYLGVSGIGSHIEQLLSSIFSSLKNMSIYILLNILHIYLLFVLSQIVGKHTLPTFSQGKICSFYDTFKHFKVTDVLWTRLKNDTYLS